MKALKNSCKNRTGILTIKINLRIIKKINKQFNFKKTHGEKRMRSFTANNNWIIHVFWWRVLKANSSIFKQFPLISARLYWHECIFVRSRNLGNFAENCDIQWDCLRLCMEFFVNVHEIIAWKRWFNNVKLTGKYWLFSVELVSTSFNTIWYF